MEPRGFGIVLGVLAGMAVFVALHVTLWRLAPSTEPRFGLLGRLALVGVGVSILINGMLAGTDAATVCAVLWIDALAVVWYFFIYAGVARSVSVTLLADLLRAPDGMLDLDAVVAAYAASSRFGDRVEHMRKLGLLRVSGRTVTLAPKGAALSRGARLLSTLTCSGLRG